MGASTRWFSWKAALLLLALVAVAAAKATGLVTVGLVTTGSMEPGLPPGSLVLALPGQAGQGDIVVFQTEDGGQVVHRVVESTPEGLVTQGDANDRTDQATGMAPVPQDRAHPVPTLAGVPATLAGTWLEPLGLITAQVALLTFGLRGVLAGDRREDLPWPLRRTHPAALLVVAGGLLLITAPSLSETVEAGGTLQVQALPIPTLVQITDAGPEAVDDPASDPDPGADASAQATGVDATGGGGGAASITHEVLAPLAKTPVEATGQTEIVRVPALPGAKTLAPHGAVWAMLPTALTVWIGAAAIRVGAP